MNPKYVGIFFICLCAVYTLKICVHFGLMYIMYSKTKLYRVEPLYDRTNSYTNFRMNYTYIKWGLNQFFCKRTKHYDPDDEVAQDKIDKALNVPPGTILNEELKDVGKCLASRYMASVCYCRSWAVINYIITLLMTFVNVSVFLAMFGKVRHFMEWCKAVKKDERIYAVGLSVLYEIILAGLTGGLFKINSYPEKMYVPDKYIEQDYFYYPQTWYDAFCLFWVYIALTVISLSGLCFALYGEPVLYSDSSVEMGTCYGVSSVTDQPDSLSHPLINDNPSRYMDPFQNGINSHMDKDFDRVT